MKMSLMISAALLSATCAGCIVAPARGGGAYVAPAGVVYVAPTYASPGPGYVWEHHPTHGWGWHHPDRGWHQGWR